MIGAGTVINPFFKVLTTVAILAAISIFVIKPILSSSEKIEQSSRARSAQAQRDAQKQSNRIQLSVQRTVALAQASSALAIGNIKRARSIRECVRKAKTLNQMSFCQAK